MERRRVNANYPRCMGTEAEVEELDRDEAAAMLAGDAERLGRIWDDGFIVNNPFNVVVSRSQVLDMVRARQIAYSSFERTAEAIRLVGDTAITMGQEVVIPNGEGAPVTRRYTHVWIHSNDQWRLAARQASIAS